MHRSPLLVGLLLASLFTTLACRASPHGRVITPDGARPAEKWSAEERARTLAAHPRFASDPSRFVLLRLNAPEEPHPHDTDVTVFVLRGRGRIHFGTRSHEFAAGDVIELPAGEVHWAEPAGSEGVEAYLVFTAPIEGR